MCPQSEQTSLKKGKKGTLLKHGISGSNRFVIKKLEEQLRSKQQRCEEAEKVNRELRAKEQVWFVLGDALQTYSGRWSVCRTAWISPEQIWQRPALAAAPCPLLLSSAGCL